MSAVLLLPTAATAHALGCHRPSATRLWHVAMCDASQDGRLKRALHKRADVSAAAAEASDMMAQRAEKQAALFKALQAKAKRDREEAELSNPFGLSSADAAVLAELQVNVTGWLGEGHFGSVLCGKRTTDGRPVAVKLARTLGREARVLRRMSGTAGFPALHHHHEVHRHFRDAVTGANAGANDVMVMDCLGPSLQNVLETDASGSHLPAATVLQIGRGALRCLRELHRAGVIHNDIKPANVMLELPGSEGAHGESACLIDFGISTRVRDGPASVCADADAAANAAGAVPRDFSLEDYCHLPVRR